MTISYACHSPKMRFGRSKLPIRPTLPMSDRHSDDDRTRRETERQPHQEPAHAVTADTIGTVEWWGWATQGITAAGAAVALCLGIRAEKRASVKKWDITHFDGQMYLLTNCLTYTARHVTIKNDNDIPFAKDLPDDLTLRAGESERFMPVNRWGMGSGAKITVTWYHRPFPRPRTAVEVLPPRK